MSITNILPICVWCDNDKQNNSKSEDLYLKLPRIKTTIENGDILYECKKCGVKQRVTINYKKI